MADQNRFVRRVAKRGSAIVITVTRIGSSPAVSARSGRRERGGGISAVAIHGHGGSKNCGAAATGVVRAIEVEGDRSGCAKATRDCCIIRDAIANRRRGGRLRAERRRFLSYRDGFISVATASSRGLIIVIARIAGDETISPRRTRREGARIVGAVSIHVYSRVKDHAAATSRVIRAIDGERDRAGGTSTARKRRGIGDAASDRRGGRGLGRQGRSVAYHCHGCCGAVIFRIIIRV